MNWSGKVRRGRPKPLKHGGTEDAEENEKAERIPHKLRDLWFASLVSVVCAVIVAQEFSRGMKKEGRTGLKQRGFSQPPLPPFLRVSKVFLQVAWEALGGQSMQRAPRRRI